MVWRRWFRRRKPIVIVSGLPRSGTSMMMRMLEAGGLPPLTDAIRRADEDNPRGYYEFERVKNLPDGDTAWLEDAARGKAVKVISALLPYLPDTYTYKVLFMQRKIAEVLASQRRMLVRRGEDPDKIDDAEMAQLFEKHLQQVFAWMDAQPNVTYLVVDYNRVVEDPAPQAAAVNAFLGRILDEAKMIAAVDPTLYRQRR